MKRHLTHEDDLIVLNGSDYSSSERSAIPNSLDLVQDGDVGVG